MNRFPRRHPKVSLFESSLLGKIEASDQENSSDHVEDGGERFSFLRRSKSFTVKREPSRKRSNGREESRKEEEVRGEAGQITNIAVSPQDFVERLVGWRGYLTLKFSALETAHSNQPTPYQIASFDDSLIDSIVSNQDYGRLEELLSVGWSPNACDNRGHSLLHKVCRKGWRKGFDLFVRHKANLVQCDSNGKTLLHEACKTKKPCFKIVLSLIRRHPHLLFVADARGACPLQYVREDQYEACIDKLRTVCDETWPQRSEGDPLPLVHELCRAGPGWKPVQDPENALSPMFISMVISGCISPQEAALLQNGNDEDDELGNSAMLGVQSVRCNHDMMGSVSSINDFSAYFNEDPLALTSKKTEKPVVYTRVQAIISNEGRLKNPFQGESCASRSAKRAIVTWEVAFDP